MMLVGSYRGEKSLPYLLAYLHLCHLCHLLVHCTAADEPRRKHASTPTSTSQVPDGEEEKRGGERGGGCTAS